MKLPTTLLPLLCLLASHPQKIFASPLLSRNELQSSWDFVRHLFDRACAGTYCGLDSQYCCTGNSICYTDAATIARCAAATAVPDGAVWQFYTTTYVLTNLVTVTSTFSSLMGGAAPTTVYNAASAAVCNVNQYSCGAVCCDPSVETCYAPGKCTPWGAIPATPTYSAPLRGTSGVGTTITAIVTTTQPFQTPISNTAGTIPTSLQSTTGNSLSPGAIAGIVIGVIAGVIILIIICFFCVLKAGFDGILGLLGLRDDRRRTSSRTEVIEERYSARGSAAGASRRERHDGWFGGSGGGRQTAVVEKRRSSLAREGGILAAIALGLAGLWAILGLRRKQVVKSSRSDVSYETYTDSYTGTDSNASK
jgi:hypothetical protein